jgi:hypothetical protein
VAQQFQKAANRRHRRSAEMEPKAGDEQRMPNEVHLLDVYAEKIGKCHSILKRFFFFTNI